MVINSMYFDADSQEELLIDLIRYLMRYSYENKSEYCDIHITPTDCKDFYVEWANVPWDGVYGGRFRFVEDDQEVCTEVKYPDDTYEYVPAGQEEDYLKAWEDNQVDPLDELCRTLGLDKTEEKGCCKQTKEEKDLNKYLNCQAGWEEDENHNWFKRDQDHDEKGKPLWGCSFDDKSDYPFSPANEDGWVKNNFGDC